MRDLRDIVERYPHRGAELPRDLAREGEATAGAADLQARLEAERTSSV